MKKINILIPITIFLTILLALALALTIKYAYVDEFKHYHTAICHLNNCKVASVTTCCPASLGRKTCSTCYIMNFNYYLLNVSYSKSDSETVYSTDFCDNNNINCYYDDRNIFDSLRLYSDYIPLGGILAIAALCFVLLTMILITITIIIIQCCSSEEKQLDDNVEANNEL